MTLKELQKFYTERELKRGLKDADIAGQLLFDYVSYTNQYSLLYDLEESNLDKFFDIYFSFKENGTEEYLEMFMKKYKFKYENSIHIAIYNLLEKEEEKEEYEIQNPLLFPGINSITDIQEGKYTKHILDTKNGIIEVYKASEIFEDTNSNYVFKKPLIKQCYARSYDFIKENKDYNVIIAYLNNSFYGGHYHAFLERNNEEIVDIASNAYYISKDFSDRVLKGKRLFKFSYEDIENFTERVDDLEEDIPLLSIMTARKTMEKKLIKRNIYDSI